MIFENSTELSTGFVNNINRKLSFYKWSLLLLNQLRMMFIF
jgi:hypothetical protein